MENKLECLNAEKRGAHACLHCNGDKSVLPFYYTGNPNHAGVDEEQEIPGDQDGYAKARQTPGKTQIELDGAAVGEGRDHRGSHIGVSPCWLEDP